MPLKGCLRNFWIVLNSLVLDEFLGKTFQNSSHLQAHSQQHPWRIYGETLINIKNNMDCWGNFFKFFSTPDRSLFEKKILRKFRYDFFHQFLPRCLQEFPKELFVRFFSRFPSRIRLGIQSEITGNFPSEISPALAQDFSRKSSRDSSSDSFRDFLRILSEFLQKFLPKFSRKSFQDCRIPLRVAFVIPQREFAEIRQLFRNHL